MKNTSKLSEAAYEARDRKINRDEYARYEEAKADRRFAAALKRLSK